MYINYIKTDTLNSLLGADARRWPKETQWRAHTIFRERSSSSTGQAFFIIYSHHMKLQATSGEQRHSNSMGRLLDEIGHIHWHFVYMGIIKLLNILERALILFRNKIYCYTLPTETTTTTNPTRRENNQPLVMRQHKKTFLKNKQNKNFQQNYMTR